MMAIRYTLNRHGRITANTDDLRRAVKEMYALMDSTNKRKTGGEVDDNEPCDSGPCSNCTCRMKDIENSRKEIK